jgi:3-hydroxybutyrate dehydrogenase
VQVRYDGADMSRADAIEEMMDTALDEFGSVDLLINNAGIQHVSPVEDFPVDKWQAILAINLSAAFHTVRLAVPAMKRKAGRIVNIASAHALVASPYKSAYVAAKHGVAGFTTVALEVARPASPSTRCAPADADTAGGKADPGHRQGARYPRQRSRPNVLAAQPT